MYINYTYTINACNIYEYNTIYEYKIQNVISAVLFLLSIIKLQLRARFFITKNCRILHYTTRHTLNYTTSNSTILKNDYHKI